MKENSKRNYKLLVSIVVTILVLAGTTYAAWKYLTEKTQIVMNVDGDRIHYDAGVDLTVTDIYPVYSMNEGITKDIEIYKETGRYDAGINLFMNLKSWPVQLSDASFRWHYIKMVTI